MRDREGREGGGGHHLSRSLAYDEAPEQCGPKATQQRRVAVLVCLERVPYHLRHLHARVEWTPPRDLQLGPLCCCCCSGYCSATVRLKLLHTPHLLRR